MIKYGLTDSGFVAPTYGEWLDEIEDRFKARFGDDIALTSNSNAGILAREFAWMMYIAGQQAQDVYNSGFTTTAIESALDRMGSNYNVKRKVEMPAHANLVITTSEEYLIQAGEEFMTDDGYTFELIEDVVTEKQADNTFQGTGIVQAQDTGASTNVLANTINIVSDPDENIISVTNPEKATGGQDYEDDESYRKRIIQSMTATPGPTLNGIKSALLALSGVREVGIVENPNGVEDKYGNPPYTVHIYVLGGDNEEIAKTLANNIAAGISLTGSKTFNVKDKMGNQSEIKFDNATDKEIYIKVNLSTTIDFNSDDIESIKGDLAAEINSLQMSSTVHLTKLYPVIYDYDGIEDAEVEIGISADALGTQDIKSSQFEVPTTKTKNIEVIVDGL